MTLFIALFNFIDFDDFFISLFNFIDFDAFVYLIIKCY